MKEWLLLALALGVSGFIAYKTFQWAYYEEIGAGLAAVFFSFAILVFLAISNYHAIRTWQRVDSGQTETAANTIQKATRDGLSLIQAEAERQKESFDLLSQQTENFSPKEINMADEAHKLAEKAISIAEDTRKKTERLSSIQVRASWENLLEEFSEIERYIERWEEKNKLLRGNQPAESLQDLKETLENLGKYVRIPESIKTLYLKRQRKYEILAKIKKEFEHVDGGEFPPTQFVLPAPPKLPSAGILGKGGVDAGSG